VHQDTFDNIRDSFIAKKAVLEDLDVAVSFIYTVALIDSATAAAIAEMCF
jgi:hypothetical protein